MRGALKESLRAWPRSLPYLKPHKGKVGTSMVLMLLSAGVALLEPWPLALLVDSVLGDNPMPALLETVVPEGIAARVAAVMVLMLLVTMAISGLGVLNDYVNTKIDMKMVLDFRSDLFQHVQRLSFDYHDERRTGEFMGRINGQASSVGAVTVAAFPLVEAALTLVGMFVVAYNVNRPVALLSLSVVPFIYYTTGYYGSRIGPEVRKVKGLEIRSLNIVHEAVQMIRVIVAFNREQDEYQKFRKQGEQAVDARIKVTVKQTVFNGVVSLITAVGTAAVLGLGAYQVRQGNLSVGQLLVLLAYIRAVYTPLETISSTMNSIQEHLIGFEMALELLETSPDVVEKDDAIELGPVRGEVTFEHVDFHYEGREHTLRDVSFSASAGDAIAIVGPTGAGKSTLMSLLPRFYDPQGGRILIDGIDVRDVTLSSLRTQISLVLQEPLLFTGTIEDNIRYGRPEATKDEVVAAAKAANAHEFIMKLPGKYRAKLGERGAKLSGGERQRISVARAFLKDAPILILDEPTSSIDSRTEAVILEALGKLMEGRTTFMVAHRLSTIQNATQVLVINDGELIERGTHDELIEAGGLYRLLHEAQQGRNVGFFTPALVANEAAAVAAAAATGGGVAVLERTSPSDGHPHLPSNGHAPPPSNGSSRPAEQDPPADPEPEDTAPMPDVPAVAEQAPVDPIPEVEDPPIDLVAIEEESTLVGRSNGHHPPIDAPAEDAPSKDAPPSPRKGAQVRSAGPGRRAGSQPQATPSTRRAEKDERPAAVGTSTSRRRSDSAPARGPKRAEAAPTGTSARARSKVDEPSTPRKKAGSPKAAPAAPIQHPTTGDRTEDAARRPARRQPASHAAPTKRRPGSSNASRQPGRGAAPETVEDGRTARRRARPDRRLDLNTANIAQVVDLDGVGPALAVAIMARRDELGGFRSIEDVASVAGVGSARLARIAEQAKVQRTTEPTT